MKHLQCMVMTGHEKSKQWPQLTGLYSHACTKFNFYHLGTSQPPQPPHPPPLFAACYFCSQKWKCLYWCGWTDTTRSVTFKIHQHTGILVLKYSFDRLSRRWVIVEAITVSQSTKSNNNKNKNPIPFVTYGVGLSLPGLHGNQTVDVYN